MPTPKACQWNRLVGGGPGAGGILRHARNQGPQRKKWGSVIWLQPQHHSPRSALTAHRQHRRTIIERAVDSYQHRLTLRLQLCVQGCAGGLHGRYGNRPLSQQGLHGWG